MLFFFFFKQKTAYEMRISDWSSDVCSSDLPAGDSILFPNRSGGRMTRSNVTQRLSLAVAIAGRKDPGLLERPGTPHTLRHTTAMHLLQSGVDITVIALWLEHEDTATTHMYVQRSEEHTSELQSLMRKSYAVFCLNKK